MSSSFRSTACHGTAALYEARRPEQTLLHRLVREHLETYLSLARQSHAEIDPVPGYIEGAFRKYLECGIPSYGFARARCNACGYDFFVSFSCQIRGICPSCNTRRMVETTAHLTDHALPNVSHRQWVLSAHAKLRESVIESAGPSGAVALHLREAARRVNIVPLSPEEEGDTEEVGERVEPQEFQRSYPYTWGCYLRESMRRRRSCVPGVGVRCGSSRLSRTPRT